MAALRGFAQIHDNRADAWSPAGIDPDTRVEIADGATEYLDALSGNRRVPRVDGGSASLPADELFAALPVVVLTSGGTRA